MSKQADKNFQTAECNTRYSWQIVDEIESMVEFQREIAIQTYDPTVQDFYVEVVRDTFRHQFHYVVYQWLPIECESEPELPLLGND